MTDKPKRYRIKHVEYGAQFSWVVVDADGEPALWQADAKAGRVPQRFRSAELAQAAADRLYDA